MHLIAGTSSSHDSLIAGSLRHWLIVCLVTIDPAENGCLIAVDLILGDRAQYIPDGWKSPV